MKKLDWIHIARIGKRDNANRWFPSADVAEYFLHIRTPSRAWPFSYANAAMTIKFAKWLLENRPEVAAKLNLST